MIEFCKPLVTIKRRGGSMATIAIVMTLGRGRRSKRRRRRKRRRAHGCKIDFLWQSEMMIG